VGTYLSIAAIALVAVGLGAAVRRWWFVGIASIPTILWLVRWLPTWGADEGDGHTGSDLFVIGFLFAGLPLIVLVALGVWLGRLAFGPPGRGREDPPGPIRA
jgi:hypothetical protein